MKVTERWLGLFNYYYIFFRVCVHTCHRLCLEVKEQLERNGSFLPLCGFWELNAGGSQGWWQVPLPVEQSYWLAIRARVIMNGVLSQRKRLIPPICCEPSSTSQLYATHPRAYQNPTMAPWSWVFQPPELWQINVIAARIIWDSPIQKVGPELKCVSFWLFVPSYIQHVAFPDTPPSSSVIIIVLLLLLHIFSPCPGHYHVSLILLQPLNWSPHHDFFFPQLFPDLFSIVFSLWFGWMSPEVHVKGLAPGEGREYLGEVLWP